MTEQHDGSSPGRVILRCEQCSVLYPDSAPTALGEVESRHDGELWWRVIRYSSNGRLAKHQVPLHQAEKARIEATAAEVRGDSFNAEMLRDWADMVAHLGQPQRRMKGPWGPVPGRVDLSCHRCGRACHWGRREMRRHLNRSNSLRTLDVLA